MAKSSLLILGNGFDINCGLKTRYRDVYDEYIITESDSKTIKDFKDNISKDFKTWADFELGMAEYAKLLNSEDELMECVNDFNYFMHNYMLKIQSDFHDVFDHLLSSEKTLSEMYKSIQLLGNGMTHDLDSMIKNREANKYLNLSFISFNYTDIFDSIISKAYSKYFYSGTVHIHGLLNDDPVLGIDNDDQLVVPYPISNKGRRCFIKPYFNKVFDSKRIDDAKLLISESNIIYVYGASLGDSDLSWRKELIDWLRADKSHHLFFYSYRYSQVKTKTIQEKLNVEDDAKKELLTNWNVDDIDSIVDQFHVPLGINLFNFRKEIMLDKGVSEVIKANKNKKVDDLLNTIDNI